ncbi:NUDIX hydrolase [Halosegnis marinus]|uniref:NUDIX hydrolase n=1 Tax=Halosegnis marinus TaxID=3034023 RepID=A0ABD5ZLP7_9EURY|nr:NUDIX hydrolase [Halosegnis sp. DT85]
MFPDAPHEPHVLRLPPERLDALEAWAVGGTGLAAAARVRDPDGRLALIENAWTDGPFLPGGGVEPGERPREAARREVREETGLDAEVGDPLVVLDQSYRTPADEERFAAAFVVFAATAAGEIPPAPALGVTDDEIRAAGWYDGLPADFHERDLLAPYLCR